MNGSRSKWLKNQYRIWFRQKFGIEPQKADFQKMKKVYKQRIHKDLYDKTKEN